MLSKIKESELGKKAVTNIPADLFSDGKIGTFEYVGSKFGSHIQDVWNLDASTAADSEKVATLLSDLSNTATGISLAEGDFDDRIDVDYDFSEIYENDFQGIIRKYDSSKAFYFNAITKIADVLHKGTDGYVFWQGMFKVIVKLLIADYYRS